MESAVHVGVGSRAKEFGSVGMVLGRGFELEELGVGPLLLILLLELDEGIAFFGLSPKRQ